jgi:N-acetylmuramoyl-L-alanine amidase
MFSGASPRRWGAASRENPPTMTMNATSSRFASRRRRAAAVLTPVLLAALLCGAASAQTAGGGDTYLDPLAYARVNASAEAVPLAVANLATGETRMAMGRYLLTDSQEMYVRSATLATVLNAGRYWQEKLRRLDLKLAGRSFQITGGSRLVVSDRGQTLLPVPVLDHEGDLWVPLVMLEQVIGPQIQEPLAWDPAERRLEMGAAEYTITGLQTEVLGRSTAVHIECAQPLGFRTSSPRSGIIEVKIYGGQADVRAVAQGSPRGLLLAASSRQLRDHTLVTLQVDQLVGRYRTYTAESGREIVVVLEEEQVSALPDPVPLGRAELNIDQGPVDVTHEVELRTVVIDAGHGGHDVGAVGRQGIMEKDVNLGVAQELRRYLERESDLRVLLTRDADEHVELAARAEIANGGDGDIFLSLHCNSWFNDAAHGLETYFLSPAQTDWARSVEAAENAAADGAAPEPDDVEFIVWELVQNRFISSSSRLAEIIQDEVSGELGLPDRGVRQAGFRVLVGAYMPAVLIEVGFLSHAEEERRLGDRDYQRQLARAIGDAILVYRDQVGITSGGADAVPAEGGGHER